MPDLEQWIVNRGKPEEVVTSGHTYGLRNGENNRWVVYGQRNLGINLVWREEFWRAMWFDRRDNPGAPISYGDRVALAFGYGGEYVRYGQRRWGINLVWSRDPVYEWELTGGQRGTPVRHGTFFGLFNRAMNDHVVYCQRAFGINLSWPSSCAAWQETTPATNATVTINCRIPLGAIGTGSSFGSVAFTGQATSPQGSVGDSTLNLVDQWEAPPQADYGQASVTAAGLRPGIWRVEARTPVWAAACNVQLNLGVNPWINFTQNYGGCTRNFEFPAAAPPSAVLGGESETALAEQPSAGLADPHARPDVDELPEEGLDDIAVARGVLAAASPEGIEPDNDPDPRTWPSLGARPQHGNDTA